MIFYQENKTAVPSLGRKRKTLVCPCDGKLSVYPISQKGGTESSFCIKKYFLYGKVLFCSQINWLNGMREDGPAYFV